MTKDLNSKLDITLFDETITELEQELSLKASKDVATTSSNGLMSNADKTKLNGIATGANNYTHPTTSGNKHIPSGGASGQFLKWSADGTAVWANDNNTTYSAGTGLTLSGTTFVANIGTGSNQVAAGNHTHNYLSLTGGDLTGQVTVSNAGFTTKNSEVTSRFQVSGDHVYISNSVSNKFLQLYNDGTLRYSGLKIYHEGNRPTASDIGALAKTSDTFSGLLTINKSGPSIKFQPQNSGDTVYMEFYRDRTNRSGWIGHGSSSSTDFSITADAGNLVLGSSNNITIKNTCYFNNLKLNAVQGIKYGDYEYIANDLSGNTVINGASKSVRIGQANTDYIRHYKSVVNHYSLLALVEESQENLRSLNNEDKYQTPFNREFINKFMNGDSKVRTVGMDSVYKEVEGDLTIDLNVIIAKLMERNMELERRIQTLE